MSKKLEAKLKELQKQGYEYVTITDVLRWIYQYKRRPRL